MFRACLVLGLSSLEFALAELGSKCCLQGLILWSLFFNGLEDTSDFVQQLLKVWLLPFAVLHEFLIQYPSHLKRVLISGKQ